MAVPSEWCARLTKWNIHEMRLKLNVEDTFIFLFFSLARSQVKLFFNNNRAIEETIFFLTLLNRNRNH